MKKANVYDVECGTIVNFPHSIYEYMVVEDISGWTHGVVNLGTGEFISLELLNINGLGEVCYPHAKSIDELYYDQED